MMFQNFWVEWLIQRKLSNPWMPLDRKLILRTRLTMYNFKVIQLNCSFCLTNNLQYSIMFKIKFNNLVALQFFCACNFLIIQENFYHSLFILIAVTKVKFGSTYSWQFCFDWTWFLFLRGTFPIPAFLNIFLWYIFAINIPTLNYLIIKLFITLWFSKIQIPDSESSPDNWKSIWT